MSDAYSQSVVVTAKPLQAVGLRQASFRGVPFGIRADAPKFGRRLAVHEYPYRELAWPEDLGKKTRRFTINGFLISNSLAYGGGDVFAQMSALIVAAETEGPGTLVHPYLGSFQVACDSLEPASGLDANGYLQFTASFVEGGQAVFPSNLASTGAAVATQAATAQTAVASDFSATITPLLPLGGFSLAAAVTAVTGWTKQIVVAAQDATSLFNLACELTGNYGRYFNGALSFLGGPPATSLPAGTTTDDLVAAQASDRAVIAATAAAEQTIAGNLGLPGSLPTDLAAAAQTLIAGLDAVVANPADAVRLLVSLAAYQSMATDPVTAAADALHQRLIVIALALAAETYQPSSYNDAANLRATMVGLLDDQITLAGDTGDDASLAALYALRTAVVADLTARGARLSVIATFTSAAAAPSLTLAQRLYRDPSRADQLVAQVDPPNPLFFPASFQALAS